MKTIASACCVVLLSGCHASETYAVRRQSGSDGCVRRCQSVLPPDTSERIECLSMCPGVGVVRGECGSYFGGGPVCTQETERRFSFGRTLGLVAGIAGGALAVYSATQPAPR